MTNCRAHNPSRYQRSAGKCLPVSPFSGKVCPVDGPPLPMVTPPIPLKNEQMMQKVLFCAKTRALGWEGICKRMSRGGGEPLSVSKSRQEVTLLYAMCHGR